VEIIRTETIPVIYYYQFIMGHNPIYWISNKVRWSYYIILIKSMDFVWQIIMQTF